MVVQFLDKHDILQLFLLLTENDLGISILLMVVCQAQLSSAIHVVLFDAKQ